MVFSVSDIPDLKGKVSIVTGANTGIGKVTALELARKGAHVILACRSKEKAEPVVEEIKKSTNNDLVQFLHLDLGSLQSVKKFAQEFRELNLPLHILVNNAGIMACPYTLTQDGIESQLGCNHVAHHYLTLLLLDILEKSQPSRVVVVSSMGHSFVSTIDFDMTEATYDATTAYGRSKLANVLFARELASRLADKQIYVNTLHPGNIDTELSRHVNQWNWIMPYLYSFLKKFYLLTPEQGALTSLYLATHEDIEKKDIRGSYFVPIGKKSETSAAGRDVELGKKLWKYTEELLKEKLGDDYTIHE